MSLIIAVWMKARLVAEKRSKPLASRRFMPSHASMRSTSGQACCSSADLVATQSEADLDCRPRCGYFGLRRWRYPVGIGTTLASRWPTCVPIVATSEVFPDADSIWRINSPLLSARDPMVIIGSSSTKSINPMPDPTLSSTLHGRARSTVSAFVENRDFTSPPSASTLLTNGRTTRVTASSSDRVSSTEN